MTSNILRILVFLAFAMSGLFNVAAEENSEKATTSTTSTKPKPVSKPTPKPHEPVVMPTDPPASLITGSDPHLQYFSSPDVNAHQPWINAILKAKSSIHMEMYHLSDVAVVQALTMAAKKGVKVQVILDHDSLATGNYKKETTALAAAGIVVRSSSPAFSITHAKMMVVDENVTFITSMNLTTAFKTTRDYGIIIDESDAERGLDAMPTIEEEVELLFESDWENYENKIAVSPVFKRDDLVLSPTTTIPQLKKLIDSAVSPMEIALTVENIQNNYDVEQSLAQAAGRGVKIRVIVPGCDENPNVHYNYPAITALAALGVETRVFGFPNSADEPYMHGKMILVTNPQASDARNQAYLGSINFSQNSMAKARELGILTTDAKILQALQDGFEADWSHAVNPNPAPTNCPAM